MVAEDPEVSAAAETPDNVTEEAIGSPLAMWELEIQNIELEKGDGGLGFSILDYQVGKMLFLCQSMEIVGFLLLNSTILKICCDFCILVML